MIGEVGGGAGDGEGAGVDAAVAVGRLMVGGGGSLAGEGGTEIWVRFETVEACAPGGGRIDLAMLALG